MSEPTKEIVPVSRHPLTILVVGAIVSSLLIPNLSHIISEHRMNDVARRTKAAEVIKASSQVDRQIHLIATAFENFQQDVSAYPLKEDEFRTEQRDLRRQIYTLYAEFDSHAWWVFHDISSEASIVGIVPKRKIEAMEKLIDLYNTNLDETVRILFKPWAAFLHPHETGARPTFKVDEIKADLDRLRRQRASITAEMVKVFE